MDIWLFTFFCYHEYHCSEQCFLSVFAQVLEFFGMCLDVELQGQMTILLRILFNEPLYISTLARYLWTFAEHSIRGQWQAVGPEAQENGNQSHTCNEQGLHP